MCIERERYYREIGIAQESLRKSGGLSLFIRRKLVCDIYCAVSIDHHTFYAQIYEDGEDYILLYAKTYAKGKNGEIKTLTFSECEKLLFYSEADSRIICGAKSNPRSDSFFCKLMECLPVNDMWNEFDGIVIDGIKTVIRSYYEGEPFGVLRFTNGEQLISAGYDADKIVFLENLYISIENIILQGG